MVPPIETISKTIKSQYNEVMRRNMAGRIRDYIIRLWFYEGKKVTINGGVTILSTGPWGGKSIMADLRVENFPVELTTGKGMVDVLLTLPLKKSPQVIEEQVHINRVNGFKGKNLDDFTAEFCRLFAKGWNS
jgi:hypothetical protein